MVLAALWRHCNGCPQDVDGSGQVTPVDYVIVLQSFGPCPFTPVTGPGDGAGGPSN
jgi:hypothetical protein